MKNAEELPLAPESDTQAIPRATVLRGEDAILHDVAPVAYTNEPIDHTQVVPYSPENDLVDTVEQTIDDSIEEPLLSEIEQEIQQAWADMWTLKEDTARAKPLLAIIDAKIEHHKSEAEHHEHKKQGINALNFQKGKISSMAARRAARKEANELYRIRKLKKQRAGVVSNIAEASKRSWEAENDENDIRHTQGYQDLVERLVAIDANVARREQIVEKIADPDLDEQTRFLYQQEIARWNGETIDQYRTRLESEAEATYEAWKDLQRVKLYQEAEATLKKRRSHEKKILSEVDDVARAELVSEAASWKTFEELVDGDVDGFLDWQKAKHQAREDLISDLREAARKLIDTRKAKRQEIEQELMKIDDEEERNEQQKHKYAQMHDQIKNVREKILAAIRESYDKTMAELEPKDD